MQNEAPFLGTGWSFPPTFRRGGRFLETTDGVEDIERSLEILLSTRVGERVMQTRYGCNVDRLLFEPLDSGLQAYLFDLIRTAVLYFEPRIVLDRLSLAPLPLEGRLDITLEYTVATTNTRYNFVYPFYLSEGIDIPPVLPNPNR